MCIIGMSKARLKGPGTADTKELQGLALHGVQMLALWEERSTVFSHPGC